MIQISELKKQLIEQRKQILSEIKSKRIFLNISPTDFKEVFVSFCENDMLKRNIDKKFVVDESNKEIINQLFYYLSGNEAFKGELSKGILLIGSVGTGKTLIINSFCNIIENCSRKVITKIHAKRVNELILNNETGFYDSKNLFIDDLGREGKEINDFGTKLQPIIDLFSIRYDLGSWTLATSNFNMETLTKFYGDAVIDRFKEMFNILVLTGKSKRE